MATLDDILRSDAMELGNDAARRRAKSEEEKRRLEGELAKVRASLNEFDLAFRRSVKFQPRINGDPQCPRCLVIKAVNFNLVPGQGGPNLDVWNCKNCGYSIEHELKY